MPSKKRAPTRAERGLERLCYLLRFKSTQLSLIPTASQPSSPSWLRPLISSNGALRSIRSALTTWYSHFYRACAEADGECRWPIMKAPKNIRANKTTLTSECDVMVSYLPSVPRTLERRRRVQDFANPGTRAACQDRPIATGSHFGWKSQMTRSGHTSALMSKRFYQRVLRQARRLGAGRTRRSRMDAGKCGPVKTGRVALFADVPCDDAVPKSGSGRGKVSSALCNS